MHMPIPIIDLFAGPGGLGEGFSSLRSPDGHASFRIALSIEKDQVAHRTLTLRAVFRHLKNSSSLPAYYDYIAGKITKEQFLSDGIVAAAFEVAAKEALCLELGVASPTLVDREIKLRLRGEKNWVLIGGPPCQAYSLAGRSRRTRDSSFDQDEKHILYREYLRIVHAHKPAVFVMENVKGLLSSRHDGASIFTRIIQDFSASDAGAHYEIRSFVQFGNQITLAPTDYIIRSENFGVPQARHRVILLGVRKDVTPMIHELLHKAPRTVTVEEAIGNLPKLRSRLSKAVDTHKSWLNAIRRTVSLVNESSSIARAVTQQIRSALESAKTIENVGGKYLASRTQRKAARTDFYSWVLDPALKGVCQHESRSHMASDLARYLFAACYAKVNKQSPGLEVFPSALLPNHKNARQNRAAEIPFADRFRVQRGDAPSTTVVAHIAKDGHYYIHYDPAQCRSLTVREAARLQTFPDNYFFEGNRTEQYTQVGNAVPPLLACQLAGVVAKLLENVARQHAVRA
jgi:DNA (cytosine-5)-methyltransferase 1